MTDPTQMKHKSQCPPGQTAGGQWNPSHSRQLAASAAYTTAQGGDTAVFGMLQHLWLM